MRRVRIVADLIELVALMLLDLIVHRHRINTRGDT